MGDITKKLKELERWFCSLPEFVVFPSLAVGAIWVLVSCMQFWIGVMDSPKSYSMRKIEVFFPAYQIGLWSGSRFNGEERLNQRDR
jgi:hypothetical protein